MASDSSGHAVKFPFPCGVCGKRFRSHFFLVEHKMKYNYTHFYCRKCRLDFPTATELYQHLDAPFETVAFEPGGGGVRCLRCNLLHASMSEFDSHFSERHPYGCKQCHLDFHGTRALQKHSEATHPNLSSVPGQNEPMEEANIEQIPAAGPRDVQEEALGPIIEGHQEGIQATIDEGVSPRAEGSGDTGAPSLPARPPQSAFGTRGFLPRRDAYYCDKCNYGFPTFPELRQHLDHSTSVLERHSTPDGGVRCFACHTIFASADGFKQHLQTLDYYHRIRLSKWCIPCLLKFHTRSGLDKHKLLVHALPPQSTSTEEVPSASPPPQPAAPALDTSDRNTQDEASGSSVPAEVANTSRPIDLLFASLLPPSQLTSSGNPSAPETAEPVESPTPVPSPSDLPEGVQPDTAPASIAPDLLPSIPPSTRATFSAGPRRPFRNYSSPRFNPLYCNRCQVAFTTLQEQKEHLRKGISAIIPDENNEENLVCAQCKQSNRDIHAMKAHLQSHETTCIECLIYFHSPRELQDHRELQHMASPNDEGTSANSWPRPQPRPIVHPPPEPRTNSPPSDQSSSLHSSQTLLPQENPQSSVNAANTFPSTVIQTPAPSLSDAPETVDAASSPSFASTALSSQPAHPARSDPLFCRKCKLAFANSQERKDHWRNGMSAIKPAQNDDDSLVCAQCNRVFANIRVMKAHLRSHDMTCISCLLYFHTGWAIRAHRQSSHTTNSGSGDDLPVEQPQAQPSPIAHPPPEPRPVSPPPDPTERPAAPAPREVRPVLRGPPAAPRNHRTVRQISLQDFSDTDEDEPSDIDNSQLGGWQDPQGQRRPDANAYSVRTGGNISGRNSRPGGRRGAEEQRWWWEGQPQPTSWDALASGRIPRDPHPIEIATSSKSGNIHPKVPRVSSVAIPCCVCLEEAAVDLTSTPCGHVGCETCLREAVKTKPECPMCRKPTRPSDLRPLFL